MCKESAQEKKTKEAFLHFLKNNETSVKHHADTMCHKVFDLCSYTPANMPELNTCFEVLKDFLSKAIQLLPEGYLGNFSWNLEAAQDNFSSVMA